MESVTVHKHEKKPKKQCGCILDNHKEHLYWRMETVTHLVLFVAIGTHVYAFKWEHHLVATKT